MTPKHEIKLIVTRDVWGVKEWPAFFGVGFGGFDDVRQFRNGAAPVARPFRFVLLVANLTDANLPRAEEPGPGPSGAGDTGGVC